MQALPALVQELVGAICRSVSKQAIRTRQRIVEGRANTYGNEPGFYITLNESLVPSKGPKKLDVRRNPDDLILVQSLPQHPQRFRPIPAMHDKLRNHRVVKHTNLRTLSETLF